MRCFLSPGKGRTLILIDEMDKLGRGASANVYRITIENKQYAAKIYHDGQLINLSKINAMLREVPDECFVVNNGIEYPQLAWPQDVIYSDSGDPVGILLPLVDTAESFTLDHYYDTRLFKKMGSHDEAALSYKLEIARNLAHVIAKLHELGHFIIDCKPQNIRVFKRTHVVSLIDCDGFSIKGKNERYPAEMLSTDYIAPEAQRRLSSPSTLVENQDRYALAVILFQLLNRGTHPFQGIITDPTVLFNTNDEKAAAGLYPHGIIPNDKITPRKESTHHLWDSKTRSMFDLAFTTGSPSARPTASQWAHHFEELLLNKGLQRCNKINNDVEHIRFRGMDCPACYLHSLPRFRPPNSSNASKRNRQTQNQAASSGNSQSRQHYPPTSSNGPSFKWLFWVLGFATLFMLITGQLGNNSKPVVSPSSSPTTPSTTAPEPTRPSAADPNLISFSDKVEYLNSRNARGDGLIFPYKYFGADNSKQVARELGDEITQKFIDASPSSVIDENIVTYEINIWPIKKISWTGSNDTCATANSIAQLCIAEDMSKVVCKKSEKFMEQGYKLLCLDSFTK